MPEDPDIEFDPIYRRARFWRRLVLGGLLGLLLIAGLVSFGRKTFSSLREERLLQQAEKALASKDWKWAGAALRSILDRNPESLRANLLMAEGLSQGNRPEALHYWARMISLQPNHPEHLLSFADAALHVGKAQDAWQRLEQAPETLKSTGRYWALRGAAASGTGRLDEAKTSFETAAKLSPDAPDLPIKSAMLRLSSRNAEERQTAIQLLEKTAHDRIAPFSALLALRDDAIRSASFSRAREYSSRILEDERHSFRDRLLHLSILVWISPTEAENFEADIRRRAAETDDNAALYGLRLEEQQRYQDLLEFIDSLPPEFTSLPAIQESRARALAGADEWEALESSLSPLDWGNRDFARRFYLALALQKQGKEMASRSISLATLRENAKSIQALTDLHRMAERAKCAEASREALKLITQHHPKEIWARRDLARALVREGKTRELYDLYSRHVAYHPDDVQLKNDTAYLAFLLGRDMDHALDMARAAWEQDRKNPTLASTYAFGLAKCGRPAEAVEIIRHLPTEAFNDPGCALNYAYVLGEAGRRDESLRIARSMPPPNVFPEEKAVLEQLLKPPPPPENLPDGEPQTGVDGGTPLMPQPD